MPIPILKFSKPFTKLDRKKYPLFCTIRGESWFKKKNQIYRILRPDPQTAGCARVKYKALMRIKDIPIEFLQYDVHPSPCSTHTDFVKLLNSFRHNTKLAQPDSFVTILICEWTKTLLRYFR